MEAVNTCSWFSTSYLQEGFAGLAISLQSERQYLKWDIPGVVSFMRYMEEAFWGSFLPELLRKKEVIKGLM